MKWETMPRGYLMSHAHMGTNQPASNPESPTLGGGEGIPVCPNTGAPFSIPKHLTTPLLTPKAGGGHPLALWLAPAKCLVKLHPTFKWLRSLSPCSA